MPALNAKKDPNLNLGDTACSDPYVVYNTASPNNDKALANVKVRQAISYAINRDHILQVLGGPTVNPPLTHVLPDVILGSKQNDPYLEQADDEATEGATEHGTGDGGSGSNPHPAEQVFEDNQRQGAGLAVERPGSDDRGA